MWIGLLTLVSTRSKLAGVAVVDRRGTALPWATAQIALLAVLDHLAELGELGREIDDAEGSLPAAVDVAAVDGPVVVEELQVLFVDCRRELRQVGLDRCRREGRRAPRRAPAAICASPSSFRWMPLIVSGWPARLVELLGRREQIDEDHAVLAGGLGHGLGVELDVLVVLLAVGDVGVLADLRGRSARAGPAAARALPLYLVVVVSLMNFSRSVLNLSQPRRSGERLVEAEGGDDHVGLFVLERVAVILETAPTGAGA